MSVTSPSRTMRREPGNARLTARDLNLLRFLAHAQPISTRHAEIVTGASLAMTRRRLRVLRDTGAARVWVEAMESVSWFTLGEAAVAELERVFGLDREDLRVPRGIGRTNLVHHGGIVSCYAKLWAACSRIPGVQLVRFLMEAEIRKQAGVGAESSDVLVPDAVAVLDVNGEQHALLFEVDTGTERNPSWLGQKFAALEDLRAHNTVVAGTASWVVCVVVLSSERRLHRLACAAAEHCAASGTVLFATEAALTDRTILGPVWKTPRVLPDGEQVTLATVRPVPGVITDRDLGGHGLPAQDAAFEQDDDEDLGRAFALEDA